MKKTYIIGLIALVGCYASNSFAIGVKVDARVQVTTCVTKRGNITCSPAQGAAALEFINRLNLLDIAALASNKLAEDPVTMKENVTINLPQNKGEDVIVSFVPSAGELKGKTIYLAFSNEEPAIGQPGAGQTFIWYSRFVEGDKQWQPLGNITTEVVGEFRPTFDVSLTQDGTLESADANIKMPVPVPLGQKVLKEISLEEIGK